MKQLLHAEFLLDPHLEEEVNLSYSMEMVQPECAEIYGCTTIEY